jgi:hypothetical protein
MKEGFDCVFMAKKGCGFNGGVCHTVVDECHGCDKARDFPAGVFCIAFPDPAIKWRRGVCNMASHIKAQGKNKEAKLNPLKASKRAAR